MASRFSYVPYDSAGGRAQNELRGYCKVLEEQILEGKKKMVEEIQIPDNEYKEEAGEAKARILNLMLIGKTQEALTQLEVLYYLLGKEIRRQVVVRLGL